MLEFSVLGRAFLFATAIAIGLTGCATPPKDFSVGQLWRATDSWLVIGKIDQFDGQIVVSVTAYDDESLETETVAHLPFSKETFLRSIQMLVREKAKVSDAFEDGYQTWRKAFDAGEAGVW